jgi:hypothetical protein
MLKTNVDNEAVSSDFFSDIVGTISNVVETVDKIPKLAQADADHCNCGGTGPCTCCNSDIKLEPN